MIDIQHYTNRHYLFLLKSVAIMLQIEDPVELDFIYDCIMVCRMQNKWEINAYVKYHYLNCRGTYFLREFVICLKEFIVVVSSAGVARRLQENADV